MSASRQKKWSAKEGEYFSRGRFCGLPYPALWGCPQLCSFALWGPFTSFNPPPKLTIYIDGSSLFSLVLIGAVGSRLSGR